MKGVVKEPAPSSMGAVGRFKRTRVPSPGDGGMTAQRDQHRKCEGGLFDAQRQRSSDNVDKRRGDDAALL
jgi:hypothetical protein